MLVCKPHSMLKVETYWQIGHWYIHIFLKNFNYFYKSANNSVSLKTAQVQEDTNNANENQKTKIGVFLKAFE